MARVGIEQLKQQASRLVARVQQGERIIVTRRGKAAALLQAIEEGPERTPAFLQWEEEVAAFKRLLPRLRKRYNGLYVAVQGGRVVDSDKDKEALYDRVFERDPKRAFHLAPVGFEEPVVELPFFETR